MMKVTMMVVRMKTANMAKIVVVVMMLAMPWLGVGCSLSHMRRFQSGFRDPQVKLP